MAGDRSRLSITRSRGLPTRPARASLLLSIPAHQDASPSSPITALDAGAMMANSAFGFALVHKKDANPSGTIPLSAIALEVASPKLSAVEAQSRIGAWRYDVANSSDAGAASELSHSLQTLSSTQSILRPTLAVVIPPCSAPKTIGKCRRSSIDGHAVSKYNKTSHILPSAQNPTQLRSSRSRATLSRTQTSSTGSSKESDSVSDSQQSQGTSMTSVSLYSFPKQATRQGSYNGKRQHITYDDKGSRTERDRRFESREHMGTNKPLPPSPGPGPELFDSSRSWTIRSKSPSPKTAINITQSHVAPGYVSPPERDFTFAGARRPPGPIRAKTTASCRFHHKLSMFDDEFMKTDPHAPSTSTSPTLSEAMAALNDKLIEVQPLRIRKVKKIRNSSISSDDGSEYSREQSTRAKARHLDLYTATPATPYIPARSSLRVTRVDDAQDEGDPYVVTSFPTPLSSGPSPPSEDAVPVPWIRLRSASIAPQLPVLQNLPLLLSPCAPSARLSILVPSTLEEAAVNSFIGAEDTWLPTSPRRLQVARVAAEDALLHIMASLPTLEDLSSTAVINRGMRRVYKQNELYLLRAVLKNESLAAWELREWSPPGSPEDMTARQGLTDFNYTALTYKNHVIRDRDVIHKLKQLILERCRSFLRPDTAEGLQAPSGETAARFETAMYRIWCFCRIFGCGKQRENDIAGQLDWLKGGILTGEQNCAATLSSHVDFDIDSVLLNAPDHFGLSNEGGLMAQELYDMLELWNCLAALLQDYTSKTAQAWKHGIFAASSVKAGDREAEAAVLEEWGLHILSLGPSAVLKLAEMSHDTNSGFALAALNGWMDWSVPEKHNTRGTFLREPLAKLYEERGIIERMGSAKHSTPSRSSIARREQDRKRIASLAAEIRAARCSHTLKRAPLVDMGNERPMSLGSQASRINRTSIDSTATLVDDTSVSDFEGKFDPSAPHKPPHSATITDFEIVARAGTGIARRPKLEQRHTSPTSTERTSSRHLLPSESTTRTHTAPASLHLRPRPPRNYSRNPNHFSARHPSPIPEEEPASTSGPIICRPRMAGSISSLRSPPADHKAPAPRLTPEDVAVQNIVALGFTPGQARLALRATAAHGQAVHVDQAVEWLLMQ